MAFKSDKQRKLVFAILAAGSMAAFAMTPPGGRLITRVKPLRQMRAGFRRYRRTKDPYRGLDREAITGLRSKKTPSYLRQQINAYLSARKSGKIKAKPIPTDLI